ncbi:para-nitrobenzyl esterase [Dyadobacter soli]|uniref:Carboxylic ester hydrolase n=2 Tax=Dyadobacter soli TaxID=659014 RepID=A0A1G8CZH2_9BACT|nr:para-nitrobenzyl esterase [Dyadobacter soli]
MNNSRRDFLQSIACGIPALGLVPGAEALAGPASAENLNAGQTARRDTVRASQNLALGETTYGKVRGYVHGEIYNFKGIPYGATTAGKARFMPPSKPAAWTGIRDTLTYGPVCPQKPNKGWGMEEYAFLYQWNDGFQGEDCLRLNIWTPAVNDHKKRPVMFWMHGGAFFSGSAQEHPSYDGENLSKLGDVVVVSVNHRLNAFGFLHLVEYGEAYAYSGNVGMLDLVEALEWVRDHIVGFGGDPGNVTIFGQSGGAAKVTTLMAMPSAKGLFHKAISQSSSTVQIATPDYAAGLTKLVLDELKINQSNIEKIHELPFQQIIQAGIAAEQRLGTQLPKGVGRAGWQPVVDGDVIPAHPFEPVVPEYSSHIPMLIGTNRNEASASINNAAMESLDEDGLRKKLAERFGDKSQQVYDTLRRVHVNAKPVEILSYISPYNPLAYLQAERKALQNAAPVYLYLFSWQTPVLDKRPRAFHCSEIPFVFANTDRCDTMTGGGEEARALADKMSKAWLSFARTGNPAHSGLPQWPDFTKNKGAMMVFDNKSEVRTEPDGEARKLLERVFYKRDF